MNLKPHQTIPRFTSRYLRVVAFITIALGIVLLLQPNSIARLFFNANTDSVGFFVRMLGSTLIGYGVLCFLAVKSNTRDAYKVAVWANLSTLLIATVISLSYSGKYTGYEWLVIGQHLIFTAGFLYCANELSDQYIHKRIRRFIEKYSSK